MLSYLSCNFLVPISNPFQSSGTVPDISYTLHTFASRFSNFISESLRNSNVIRTQRLRLRTQITEATEVTDTYYQVNRKTETTAVSQHHAPSLLIQLLLPQKHTFVFHYCHDELRCFPPTQCIYMWAGSIFITSIIIAFLAFKALHFILGWNTAFLLQSILLLYAMLFIVRLG